MITTTIYYYAHRAWHKITGKNKCKYAIRRVAQELLKEYVIPKDPKPKKETTTNRPYRPRLVRTPSGNTETLASCCRKYSLSKSQIIRKIAEQEPGWSYENPRDTKLAILSKDGVTTPKKSFASISLAATYYGIPTYDMEERFLRCEPGYTYGRPVRKIAVGNPGQAVITPAGQFPSITAAARAMSVEYHTIALRINQMKPGYSFVDPERQQRVVERYRPPKRVISGDGTRRVKQHNQRWVTTPLGDFPSLRAAGDAYRVHFATIRYRIQLKEPGYRYRDPEVQARFERENPPPARGRGCIVRAVITPLGEFASLSAAAKAIGCDNSTVKYRIEHGFPGYSFKT